MDHSHELGTSRVSSKPKVRYVSSPNQSARNGATIKRIILHYTTSRSIEGVIEWFREGSAREGKPVSSHYIVAVDGEIVQMVQDGAKAWHAFGENADSIGIEVCAEKGDTLTNLQSLALAHLVRYLAEEYDLRPSAITAHRFTPANKGRTDCPGDLWKSEAALAQWVSNVLVAPVPPSLPAPVPGVLPMLELGDTLPAVRVLHEALVVAGKLGEGDHGDTFTRVTQGAVLWFQSSNGLKADGIVGPKTWAALPLKRDKPTPVPPVPKVGDATLEPGIGVHDGAWSGLRRLTLWVGDTSFSVASGARGAQMFRKPSDPRSRPGNLEPIPQGKYFIGSIEFAGGKDNYEGSFGAGLGPVWVGLDAEFSDDRGAFGFHLDHNIGASPGSAGCIVFPNVEELKRFVAALRKHDPSRLVVEWGLA